MQSPLEQLLEVSRGISHLAVPLIAQPAHVLLYRVNELLTLFFRVRIIKAQVTSTTKLLRQAKIDGDRLGVTNMEVTVRLGRKPRDDGSGEPCVEIALNLCSQKITAQLCGHANTPG